MPFVLKVAQEALDNPSMKSGKWQKSNLGTKSLLESTEWQESTIVPNAMHPRVNFVRQKSVWTEGINIKSRLNAHTKSQLVQKL